MMERIKTRDLFTELRKLIPGGVNSPTRAFKGVNIEPMIVKEGKKDLIIDLDDHTYIDFNHAWGSLILGHAHPKVIEAAKNQMEKGSSFGITTEIEYAFAKKMHQLVPSLEKSRVVASGTEATMTALRLARAYTKKNAFVKFNGHYHGHSDAFLIRAGSGVGEHCQNSSSQGVPLGVVQHSYSLPFNDQEALDTFFKEKGEEIAAVILEPIAGNMGVVASTQPFMKQLHLLCQKYGALLIFDEVMTGFRVAKECAQGLYGVRPDLSTFSKIIGGGYPVGLVGGRGEVMDLLAPTGPVYQAGTLSGNPVALSAGLAVLEAIDEESFYEKLQNKMDLFLKPIEEQIKSSVFPVCLNRQGAMFSFFWGLDSVSSFEDLKDLNKEWFVRFFTYLFEKGIYISPSAFEASFVSMAHQDQHLLYTQQVILDFFALAQKQFCSGSITNICATSK